MGRKFSPFQRGIPYTNRTSRSKVIGKNQVSWHPVQTFSWCGSLNLQKRLQLEDIIMMCASSSFLLSLSLQFITSTSLRKKRLDSVNLWKTFYPLAKETTHYLLNYQLESIFLQSFWNKQSVALWQDYCSFIVQSKTLWKYKFSLFWANDKRKLVNGRSTCKRLCQEKQISVPTLWRGWGNKTARIILLRIRT